MPCSSAATALFGRGSAFSVNGKVSHRKLSDKGSWV